MKNKLSRKENISHVNTVIKQRIFKICPKFSQIGKHSCFPGLPPELRI